MLRSVGTIAVVAALVWPAAASAQSNYRLSPIGGRSQLLGGTGVVYGRDAAAAFINPATAVLVDDSRLSFSLNVYTMTYVYAPRWYLPGPIDRSKFGELTLDNTTITDFAASALPSSLCFFFRAGDVPGVDGVDKGTHGHEGRIGFCLATLYGQSFNYAADGFSEQHAASVSRQAQTLSQSYTRFAAGPTYAIKVSDTVSFGASIHGTIASHRSLLAASATTYGSSPSPLNSMFYNASRGDSFQLEAMAGATMRFGTQTVGLSVRAPSVHVYGVGGANLQSHYDGAGSETSLVTAKGSFVSRAPLRVGIGTGVQSWWGQAEFNAFYSSPLGQSYIAELTGHESVTSGGIVDDRIVNLLLSERARNVVNLAAGGELFVSPELSLLAGLATDVSAVPSGQLRGSIFNYYPSQTNRVAGSFGVGSHGDGGELLIGGEVSVGWGSRLAVNSYQLPPVIGTTGHGTYQLAFIVAGSTSFRAMKRAVENVRDVLKEPKPKKPPEAPPTPPR